jgi:hypothetical protein
MNLLLYMAPVVLLSLVPTTIILEPGALLSMRELAQQHRCASRHPEIYLTNPASSSANNLYHQPALPELLTCGKSLSSSDGGRSVQSELTSSACLVWLLEPPRPADAS